MVSPNFKKAVQHLKHEGFSDLFSFQPEYQFIFSHTETTIDILILIDELILKQKNVNFLPPLNDLFSIGRYSYRSGSLLDPFLHIYATAVVMAMQDKIEKFRPLVQSNTVFSYRMIEGSDTHWFDPDIGWGKFNETNINLAKNSHFVGSADIASFYTSLRPIHFKCPGFLKLFPGEYKFRLDAVLEYIRLEEDGLPVGGSFARILAEIVLAHIDIELQNAGIIFTRFVDDFRIFSKDEIFIGQDIYTLTKILNNYGLHINRQKVSVLKSSYFIETLYFKSASLISNSKQKSTIINPLFDPYAELVIGRVDELKSISETQSLHQAAVYEMEKISADISSLKVIISAAQYCTIDECFLTISEILGHFNRPEMYVVMLRLSKVIETRSLEFSQSASVRLSEIIEQVFTQGRHEFPLSLLALLLNARLNINVVLQQKFENLLTDLYRQLEHEHLKRNIYILLEIRSKNNKAFLKLNKISK